MWSSTRLYAPEQWWLLQVTDAGKRKCATFATTCTQQERAMLLLLLVLLTTTARLPAAFS